LLDHHLRDLQIAPLLFIAICLDSTKRKLRADRRNGRYSIRHGQANRDAFYNGRAKNGRRGSY
jgi:hypothetical protein